MGVLVRLAHVGVTGKIEPVWFMNKANVSVSLHRLEQAGELVITDKGVILFPDTPEFEAYQAHFTHRADFIKAWRRGEIKIIVEKQPKKGPKP